MKARHLALAAALALLSANARGSDDDELLVPEGEDVPTDLAQPGFSAFGEALAFTPDGHSLAVAGSESDRSTLVRFWDLASGLEISRRSFPTTSRARSIAFSSDGRIGLLTAHEILVANLQGSAPPNRIPVLPGTLAFAFRSDGQIVVALMNGRFGPNGRETEGPADSATYSGASFSTDASTVAFRSSGTAYISVWDVNTNHQIGELSNKDSNGTLAIGPRPHPMALVAPFRGSAPALFDARSGTKVRDFSVDSVEDAAISFDGTRLAIDTRSKVRVFDMATGREDRSPISLLPNFILSLSISKNGERLAVGQLSGEIALWDLPSARPRWHWSGGTSPMVQANITPDGTVLAATTDNKVHLLDVERREQRWEAGPVGEGTSPTAFSPDGQSIALALESSIEVRDVRSDNNAAFSVLGSQGQGELAYLRNGQIFAVASAGVFSARSSSNAALYTQDGKKLREYEIKGPDGVLSLAVSPDDKTIAVGRQRDAVLVNLASGRVTTLRQFPQNSEGVGIIGFSPDGKQVIACEFRNGVCSLSDARSGGFIRTEPGYAMRWTADGKAAIRQPHPGEITVERDGRVTRLINGFEGDWAVIDGGRLYRHDRGRLLYRAIGTDLRAVLPPRPATPPQLVSSVEVAKTPGQGAESGSLSIKIANQANAGRAYWVRVRGKNVPAGLHLSPPIEVMRIDPGATKTIEVPVSVIQPGAPHPADVAFDLVVEHAFGEGPTVPVKLHVRAPVVDIVARSPVTNGNQASAPVDLVNVGDQTTSGKVTGWIDVAGRKETLPAQDLQPLAAGATRTVAFAVPASVKRQKFVLHVDVAGSVWPTHAWSREASLRITPPLVLYAGTAVLALMLFVSVYFVRVYRDPVVVQAARDPQSLRQLALTDLATADARLRRARRLGGALAAAAMPAARWQRAVKAGAGNAEAAARAFAEAIGAELEEPFHGGARPVARAWRIRLPSLRLRFAQSSAVTVFTGDSLEAGAAAATAELIRDEGRGPSAAIAIDLTRSQDAASILKQVPQVVFVTLNAAELRDLLLSPQPQQAFEEALTRQRPVVELSPYQVGGGVEDEDLFYGRDKELRLMADRRPRNVLLVGPRQMGKTSLLKAVTRRMKSRDDVSASFLLMTGSDLLEELRTRADGNATDDFRRLAAGTKERPKLWLIDEADAFAKMDAQAGNPMAAAMRAFAEEGVAYFVLAGYWDLYRTALLTSRGPFRNFGEIVRLGPLDREAARDLATKPMSSLRLSYDSDATVERLLDETGCRANLVSVVCNGLIQTLDPSTRVLSGEHLERVLHTYRPLHDELKFWRASPSLDRLLVRAAFDGDKPTAQELQARVAKRGVTIAGAAFVASLERLEMSYVLTPTPENRLRCPIPVLEWFIRREPEELSMLASQVKEEAPEL